MNRTAFCLLLASLCMTASLTTIESTARFKTTAASRDQARIAHPSIKISASSATSDLGLIQPGETKTFDFFIINESVDSEVSEVALDYWLLFMQIGEVSPSLQFTLFYLDDNQVAYPVTPDGNGQFDGYAHFDTVIQTHCYRLHVTLPINATLPEASQAVQIDIHLTAIQTDQ